MEIFWLINQTILSDQIHLPAKMRLAQWEQVSPSSSFYKHPKLNCIKFMRSASQAQKLRAENTKKFNGKLSKEGAKKGGGWNFPKT